VSWRKRRATLKSLAEGLVKAGALQFGSFALPDGRESSYYIDLRAVPSFPGLYGLVVDSIAGVVGSKARKSDALCGVPMTGLALASPVAVALKKPLVYTRLAGTPEDRMVEGVLKPGWDVALVDDLSTSGKSILASSKALEQEGAEVSSAVVLIDRLEGARERLSKSGISLHPVTDVMELADTLAAMELISDEHLKSISKSVGRRQ
jgi:orotate phosphoribosyltransferase